MSDLRSVRYQPPFTFDWYIESWDVGDDKGVVSTCTHVRTGERRVIVHENTPEGYAELGKLIAAPEASDD